MWPINNLVLTDYDRACYEKEELDIQIKLDILYAKYLRDCDENGNEWPVVTGDGN